MKEEVRPHDLFAYQIDTNSGKGVFTLANYPEKLNTMSRHYRTIPLNKANTNGHWEVNLHSVYFDNDDIIKLDVPLSIGIGGSLFGINQNVFNYLLSKHFYKEIENRQCAVEKEDVLEIYCEMDYDINSFGTLSLVVGKWNLKLKPERLFREKKVGTIVKNWFAVVYYPEHNGQFYLSQSLLNGVNTIVYNREDHLIGVYQGNYN